MNKPEISVIMGVYNTPDKNVLKQAIESVLNQTFSNFEFIICDDGSTDDTFHLLKELTAGDQRCVLLKNDKNSGLAYSLDRCISVSKGKYLARMDADDISDVSRFEKEFEFLESHPEYSIVSCVIKLFDESGVYGIRTVPEKPLKEDMLFRSPFVHPAVMMRKDAVQSVNGYRVCKKTRRCEDIDLWMRMYAHGYKGYNIQTPLYLFREDSNAYKRRKYRYRIEEAEIRLAGYRELGMLPKGYIYALKPLTVGLIPGCVMKKIRKMLLRKKRL